MEYTIKVLSDDLRLIEEGLRTWGDGYHDAKKRQLKKAKELKDAIKKLEQWTQPI
jgi:hypothetical protein